jgi:hypothetical protein
MRTLRISLGLALLALPIGQLSLHAAASGPRPAQSTGPGEAMPLIIPARRPASAPPAAPPPLPPAAENVTPVTLETRLRQRSGTRNETVRQTIHRTVDRIHVAAGDGREWLFQRNPRDPRRVSGTLIDHAARALVFHDESDLRNRLGIHGWAQVLALGFDHALLDRLRPTATSRSIGAVRAVRYVSDEKDAELRELWWSEKDFLPTGFTVTRDNRSVEFSVARMRAGVNTTLLRAPAERFPAYRTVDLADWLEGH